jgi:hypothetical protein
MSWSDNFRSVELDSSKKRLYISYTVTSCTIRPTFHLMQLPGSTALAAAAANNQLEHTCSTLGWYSAATAYADLPLLLLMLLLRLAANCSAAATAQLITCCTS